MTEMTRRGRRRADARGRIPEIVGVAPGLRLKRADGPMLLANRRTITRAAGLVEIGRTRHYLAEGAARVEGSLPGSSRSVNGAAAPAPSTQADA